MFIVLEFAEPYLDSLESAPWADEAPFLFAKQKYKPHHTNKVHTMGATLSQISALR